MDLKWKVHTSKCAQTQRLMSRIGLLKLERLLKLYERKMFEERRLKQSEIESGLEPKLLPDKEA